MSQSDSRPRTTSEEIRIIRAKSGASDTALLIQATTRAVLSLVVILSGAYLLISQTPVPDGAWQIALLVLGAYFGSEALHKFLQKIHNNK